MILRTVEFVILARLARASYCAGKVSIDGTDGSYLMGAGGHLSARNLTLHHNSGFSFTRSCKEHSIRDPHGFKTFKLLGHTLSFTVDLSSVGCACNLALFLVKAPARNLMGEPSEGACSWNPYYCDANGVCGQYCPEMDIMEANNRVFSSTPHRCGAASPKGHYSSCDKTGCRRSTNDLSHDAYGPGRRYRIDTRRPFDVLMAFHGNGQTNPAQATFTGMDTRLRQGASEVILDFSECGGYFSSMANAMAEGMAMRITYWGGEASTMSWLDQPHCGAVSCSSSSAGDAVISNLEITSLCPRELSIRGVEGTSFVKGFEGNASGDHLLMWHNSGFSVMESCEEDWHPNHFKIFKLLGKTLTFTVDLSEVGCACNLALYLIQGPPRDWSGNPGLGSCDRSPYYCDANRVCGQWCPEIDVMEANNHVFQSTPHRCDKPSISGHYSNCDRKGCAQTTQHMDGHAYGPGAEYTIDTRHPFSVHTTFHGSAYGPQAIFTGLTTRLQQGTHELVLNHSSCGGYLGSIADAMAGGMSMRITYWGDSAKTMKWLDQPPCGSASCSGSNAGKAVISGIMVSGNHNRSAGKPIDSGIPHLDNASNPGTPWCILFVCIVTLQCCMLCGLGAFTFYLQQQIPLGMPASPSSSRQPLTQSPPTSHAEPPPLERTRNAMPSLVDRNSKPERSRTPERREPEKTSRHQARSSGRSPTRTPNRSPVRVSSRTSSRGRSLSPIRAHEV
mmetsp:Transcript_52522/g.122159  ORF Transcript_52522/g.122159 Transcript_52522/m.122159 type:complete len:730 (-) Transcript_52522:351-2540(-)